MNIFRYTIALALSVIFCAPCFAELLKTDILGNQYYYHEVKKGESIYGIARKYGWDVQELTRLNPHAAAEMKKGSRLYYPVAKSQDQPKDIPLTASEVSVSSDIDHIVKRGETVYSISKMYGIPLNLIYEAYPSAKYGIKAGDRLQLKQPANSSDFVYYDIKPGDTLYSTAKTYATTIEDILKYNPGISEHNFRSGETIRIKPHSAENRFTTKIVEEEQIASIDNFKVKKNDSWKTISEKTGISEESLRKANSEIANPEKDEIIAIPIVKKVEVEKTVEAVDSRELSSEGIKEMYDSIHHLDPVENLAKEAKVFLILDDPTSKKDIDFTRGFLLALNELKNAPFKTRLQVIDGGTSTSVLTDSLEKFEPNIVIATADKNFPAFLADYGETNHIEIVNVFDVKNDLYEDNPSMIQILPPSSLFNEQTADRLISDYHNNIWLFAGVEDSNDAIAELLKSQLPKQNLKQVSTTSLHSYPLSASNSYTIYAYPQKKEEVNELLSTVKHLRDEYPGVAINIVGRPNWVTLTELFKGKFNDADIIIPARCWLDLDSPEGKSFTEVFHSEYDQVPVKSFPNFAATGYDIAMHFIEATANNGGDYNLSNLSSGKTLQTEFGLQRFSNWGGFVNKVTYLLIFRPYGEIEKVILK